MLDLTDNLVALFFDVHRKVKLERGETRVCILNLARLGEFAGADYHANMPFRMALTVNDPFQNPKGL